MAYVLLDPYPAFMKESEDDLGWDYQDAASLLRHILEFSMGVIYVDSEGNLVYLSRYNV